MIGSLLRPLTDGLQDERIQYDTAADRCKITPFLKVFMKAGRLTSQWVRLDFNQVADFGKQATVDLIRKGHFITRLFLVTTLPDISTVQAAAAATGAHIKPNFGWTNSIGHALVQQAQLTISGEIVDTLDSNLLEILDEYYTPLEKVPAVNELIGRRDTDFNQNSIGYSTPTTVYVPLPFWFTRGDSAAALPIDALPTDQIQVRFNFRALQGCYYTDSRTTETFDPQVDGSALWPLSGAQLYKLDAAGSVIPGLNPSAPTARYSPLQGYKMPTASQLHLGDTYLLAEYIYVDKPEANRFRVADLKYPVLQHYIIEPADNKEQAFINIPIRVPNPTRALYWISQRYEVPAYNAHFLATRDLSANYPVRACDTPVPQIEQKIWWPNAQGLQDAAPPPKFIPAFALRDSEPLNAVSFVYEGNLARFATTAPALFRSVLMGPLYTKTPWVNRYYYTMPFGIFPGVKPLTVHCGEANLDKLKRAELRLQFAPKRGYQAPMTVNRYITRIYVETYNIFRVYGGRGSMLFSY